MSVNPLDEYVALARRHDEPNDGSKAWVRRVNQAADRLEEIARSFLSGSADDVLQFASLLDSQEERAKLWSAHHLLELAASLEPPLVAKALAVIEHNAESDSIEALGERMWLEDWYSRGKPQ